MKDTGAVGWGYMGVCLTQSFLDTQLQEKNDSIYYLRSPPQASTVLVECGMRLWYRMTCIMGTMRARHGNYVGKRRPRINLERRERATSCRLREGKNVKGDVLRDCGYSMLWKNGGFVVNDRDENHEDIRLCGRSVVGA